MSRKYAMKIWQKKITVPLIILKVDDTTFNGQMKKRNSLPGGHESVNDTASLLAKTDYSAQNHEQNYGTESQQIMHRLPKPPHDHHRSRLSVTSRTPGQHWWPRRHTCDAGRVATWDTKGRRWTKFVTDLKTHLSLAIPETLPRTVDSWKRVSGTADS